MGITKSSSGQQERTGLLSRLFKPKASECCDGVILEADDDVDAAGQSNDCCAFTIVEEDEDDNS